MSVKQSTVKNTRELKTLNKAASTVLSKDTILMITDGLAVPATSSTVVEDLGGICNQDISAADALEQVPVISIDSQDTFIINTTNNSDATHNNQVMVLTDESTVDNTGTTSATGIIVQVEPYGAAADKKIVARFVTL